MWFSKRSVLQWVPMIIAIWLGGFATPAFCSSQKVLQEGGPYVCSEEGKLQKFTATITIDKTLQNMPFWFTMYNGYGRQPGFNWVRVFLCPPGQTGSDMGEILADEHTFTQKNAITIDLSGRLSSDGNQLFIEGEGAKGDTFSWVLSTVNQNALAVVDSSSVTAGQTFWIHGVGFSTNNDDNKVTIDGQNAQVLSSSTSLLSVKAPDKLSDSTSVPLTVSVGALTSTPIRAMIKKALPPHIISMSPYGGPMGGTLNLECANLSPVAEQNVVWIGPYKSPQVTLVDKDSLLVTIPDWGESGGTLPVKVISNGVTSDNRRQFWCMSHYYGGDPNASVYQYD